MTHGGIHYATTGDELAGRLEAYAARRLSPDAATVARMRARVMREAEDRLARVAGGPARPVAELPVVERAARSSSRVGRRRRAVGALMAATVAASVAVGSAFAAAPGGPLYPLRLLVETVGLPGDPAARAQANAARLDARIDEAIGGLAQDNPGALAAALDAYARIVDEALLTAGGDPARLAALEGDLARHRSVLERILATVPLSGQPAVGKALLTMEQADRRIDEAQAAGGPEPIPDPALEPQPDSTEQPDRTAKPLDPPTATPTDLSTPTRAPDPTATLAPTPRPHSSPEPRPTEKPPHSQEPGPTAEPTATAEPTPTPPASPSPTPVEPAASEPAPRGAQPLPPPTPSGSPAVRPTPPVAGPGDSPTEGAGAGRAGDRRQPANRARP